MPGFTYVCGPFTQNKERIQKLKKKKTEDSRYIYQNELDKAWFQHDLTYGDFEDLNRRTTADKVLRDKAFSIANMMDVNTDLLLWFINFLIK